jgi:NAD+ diphosphatase
MTANTKRTERYWWVFHGRTLLLSDTWAQSETVDPPVDPRPPSSLDTPVDADHGSLEIAIRMGSGLLSNEAPGQGHHEPAQAFLGATPPTPPAGYQWVDLRAAASVMSPAFFRSAGRAWQLLEWRRTHRYCGVCGTPTRPGPYDALICPSCDHLSFPRLSPAVIVLVHDGDRALLGRGPHLPEGMFSTLAGFVEPGESLEETVHREILEEADVEVDMLRYFGSQPWPFPHSLMVGFFARYAGGSPRPADGELEEVGWFHRSALPHIPGRASIARSLIDAWLSGQLP